MKVVFLDRDGVINKYPGDTRYVTRWEEFKFIPGSIEAIAKFNEKGFNVFIVSNQAGVGKGLYSEKELNRITKNMVKIMKRKNAEVTGIYYCTHRPQDNCFCRKPKTGLLVRALKDFGLSPTVSFLIGDSMVDIETAKNFGIKSVLLLSGKEKISHQEKWPFKPDYIFDNLLIASYYLCSHYE